MDFGFSGELIFLALLGLILFGPRKLPEIARKAGRIVEDLKRAKDEFQDQLKSEVESLDPVSRHGELEGNSTKSLLTSLYDDLKSVRSLAQPEKTIQAVIEPVRQSLDSASVIENANRIKELLLEQEANAPLSDPPAFSLPTEPHLNAESASPEN